MKNKDSEKSLFLEVWEERNAELNFFDAMIADPTDFLNHLIVVIPDDQIIRFYDYLVSRQRKLEKSFDDDYKETILYGNIMTLIMKLEELEVIDNHKKALEEEAKKTAERIKARILEPRKVKRLEPFRNLFNRKNNR
jgi:hypothetical protein